MVSIVVLQGLPHVITADDSIRKTKAHHETARGGLLSVEHASVLDTNIDIITANFLPVVNIAFLRVSI